MDRYTIYRADRSHAALIAELLCRAFSDVAERFALTPQNCPKHPSNYTAERVFTDFERGAGYYILEADGKICGCVAWEYPRPDCIYLERLAVFPEQRGRGRGQALVEHVLQRAAHLGVASVQIGIIAAHDELKQWYQKLGFEETETRYFEHLPFKVTFMSHNIAQTGLTKVEIIPMTQKHWPRVREIYQQGIDTGHATFDEEAPDWDTWNLGHNTDCRLVAVQGDTIVGWAALSSVSRRCAYKGVAEDSVYIDPLVQGQGVGMRLLSALTEACDTAGYWTLLALIFPENKASIALHEKCGFRYLATHEKFGVMKGQWRDVALLERRSLKTEV
jgi:phosphinothricin acetyltransferase